MVVFIGMIIGGVAFLTGWNRALPLAMIWALICIAAIVGYMAYDILSDPYSPDGLADVLQIGALLAACIAVHVGVWFFLGQRMQTRLHPPKPWDTYRPAGQGADSRPGHQPR